MEIIHVFIPSTLLNQGNGFLHGHVRKSSVRAHNDLVYENVTSFYILGICQEAHCEIGNVGYYVSSAHKSVESAKEMSQYRKQCKNWLLLEKRNSEFTVEELWLNNWMRDCVKEALVFLYDPSHFLCSALLMEKYFQTPKDVKCENHVTVLMQILSSHTSVEHSEKSCNLVISESSSDPLLYKFCDTVLLLINFLISLGHRLYKKLIPKFITALVSSTSTGSQLFLRLEQVRCSVFEVFHQRKLSVKNGNSLTSVLFDVFIGVLVLHCVLKSASVSVLFEAFIGATQVVLNSLQHLIYWLMGVPAGLKLNYLLNSSLGRFFLYHIYLWRMYIDVAQPVLLLLVKAVALLGYMGMSFQLCLLNDLISLATFHVYCFYVYAARLYNLQVSGLCSLWRLFRGKKWNPLRQRVDSCSYSVEQLFIGTLTFTVLLFLLPTIMLYYVVFLSLRLVVLGIEGIIARLVFITNVIPLYATLLWVVQSSLVAGDIKMHVVSYSGTNQPLLLALQTVCLSLPQTVLLTLPDLTSNLPTINWHGLLSNLIWGRLIYPL